jgi:zinc protease
MPEFTNGECLTLCVAVPFNASSAEITLFGPGNTQSATSAQTESAEHVVSAEGITEYRLPNGLRALLFPDQSKQTITVNITYLVGSRHENYGETGMAHLLEHLVFKGTPRHPNVPKELNDRGARWEGGTEREHTNYFETFPATEENFELGS